MGALDHSTIDRDADTLREEDLQRPSDARAKVLRPVLLDTQGPVQIGEMMVLAGECRERVERKVLDYMERIGRDMPAGHDITDLLYKIDIAEAILREGQLSKDEIRMEIIDRYKGLAHFNHEEFEKAWSNIYVRCIGREDLLGIKTVACVSGFIDPSADEGHGGLRDIRKIRTELKEMHEQDRGRLAMLKRRGVKVRKGETVLASDTHSYEYLLHCYRCIIIDVLLHNIGQLSDIDEDEFQNENGIGRVERSTLYDLINGRFGGVHPEAFDWAYEQVWRLYYFSPRVSGITPDPVQNIE